MTTATRLPGPAYLPWLCLVLGSVHIRAGDWRWSRVDSRIRAVTAAEVQAFVRTRMSNLQTVILADPGTVDQRLFLDVR